LVGVRNEILARTYANTLWPAYGALLLRHDLDTQTRKTHELTQALDTRIREMSRDAPVLKITSVRPISQQNHLVIDRVVRKMQ
jgi:hypothetical protein